MTTYNQSIRRIRKNKTENLYYLVIGSNTLKFKGYKYSFDKKKKKKKKDYLALANL